MAAILMLAGTVAGAADPGSDAVRVERAFPQVPATGTIEVKLTRNKAAPADRAASTVSFGVPFPPGLLKDAANLKATDAADRPVPLFTQELCRWRIDGKEGDVRAVLVQFDCEVPAGAEVKVTLYYGAPGEPRRAEAVAVADTLVEATGQQGPAVWAVLPAAWLCSSWVAGPQLPAQESRFPEYEKSAAENFEKQKPDMTSMQGASWLFDRTTSLYKMYVRTGELKYLEAAWHCAHFVRNQSLPSGVFKLSNKFMYVYPRAQGLHYMLSGDPRARALLAAQGEYFLKLATERMAEYKPGGGMWTERNIAYTFSGLVYAYEMEGGEERWARMKMYADKLHAHQTAPPDGKPADGSWRHRWTQHDASEAKFEGGSSSWMTALMLDPLFEYWLLSGDERVPGMLTRWCEFLSAKGLNSAGTKSYYVINALDGGGSTDNYMEQHNLEMAYMFAMGIYFSRDKAQQERFAARFTPLLKSGAEQTHVRPPRRFNWSFQNSSAISWFIARSGYELPLNVAQAGKTGE
ncbi:MAG: hypothetical protein M5U26_12285 [Planctomycetota bacterium]|nr:hypothetical protein [Planctomycetota bacterium]